MRARHLPPAEPRRRSRVLHAGCAVLPGARVRALCTHIDEHAAQHAMHPILVVAAASPMRGGARPRI